MLVQRYVQFVVTTSCSFRFILWLVRSFPLRLLSPWYLPASFVVPSCKFVATASSVLTEGKGGMFSSSPLFSPRPLFSAKFSFRSYPALHPMPLCDCIMIDTGFHGCVNTGCSRVTRLFVDTSSRTERWQCAASHDLQFLGSG